MTVHNNTHETPMTPRNNTREAFVTPRNNTHETLMTPCNNTHEAFVTPRDDTHETSISKDLFAKLDETILNEVSAWIKAGNRRFDLTGTQYVRYSRDIGNSSRQDARAAHATRHRRARATANVRKYIVGS